MILKIDNIGTVNKNIYWENEVQYHFITCMPCPLWIIECGKCFCFPL